MKNKLHFNPITINDKPMFDRFLKKFLPAISELTFTNLFCWRMTKGHEYTVIDDHLLVAFFEKEKRKFYQPIGESSGPLIPKILDLFPDCSFERVEEKTALALGPDFLVKHDRDMYDYIYLRKELKLLEGTRYDAKRNFIRRCEKYNPQVCNLDESTVENFLKLEEEWCNIRNCHENESMYAEDLAVRETLKNFKTLQVLGICVWINGRIEAFAIGEALNETTFVEHFEKANTKFDGLYAYVLHEFVKCIPEKFIFLNREQDLGLEGLRKAKLSYHPHSFIKKYTLRCHDLESAIKE